MYRERMKMEEAFQDLKRRLGMVHLMRKTQESADKTLRLLALAYALGRVIGEVMRGRWQREKGGVGWRKGRDYSGLFLRFGAPTPNEPLEGAWPLSPGPMAGGLGRSLANLAVPLAAASACRNMRGKLSSHQH